MNKSMIEKILKTINILYVEENNKFNVAVSEALQLKCNNVFSVKNIKDASDIYNNKSIDIIITDIVFSNKMIGINFIKNIRDINKTIPIIVISSVDDIEYIIKLIKHNLTEYIQKPIQMSKLKESLTCAVKRIMEDGNYIIYFDDDIEYNVQKNILSKKDVEIELTSNERKLLNLLLVNKSYILSQNEISDFIWPDKFEITESAFKSLISRLRLKIGKKSIKNSPGNGYILEINK